MPPQKRRVEKQVAREVTNNLGDDYKFTRNPVLAATRAENRKRRRLAAAAASAPEVTCQIEGCNIRLSKNHLNELTVCTDHAAAIWEIVERRDKSPYLRATLAASIRDRDRIRAQHRSQERAEALTFGRSPEAPGDIYFVRVNGLIKVGWTTDLHQRVRSYGPGAELLAHYDGFRCDEANLHKQLTPARVKGREWYADSDILAMYITETLTKHGPPSFTTVAWTDHDKPTVKPKTWR